MTWQKLSQTKSNMLVLRSLVEIYGSRHKGNFPRNIEELYEDAMKADPPYWKDIINPYSKQSGMGISIQNDLDKGPKKAGGVGYYPVENRPPHEHNPPRAYYIYGYNVKGDKIQVNGKVMYLN